MRVSYVLRHARGCWGRGPMWSEKFAENSARSPWWDKNAYYSYYHQRRPRPMILKFFAGVAVGYIACANYPPKWMNLDYVKTRKCLREERENEFTTKVINPEFIKNYDAENGLLTISLPESIKEKFNRFNSKREDFQNWSSKQEK